MLKISWRIGALLVSCRCVGARRGLDRPGGEPRSIRGNDAHLDGRRPQGRRHEGRERLGRSKSGVNVQVVQKEFGEIRSELETVKAEDAPDVIVGRARLDGRAGGQRPRRPARPDACALKAIPGVRAQGVLVRHGVKRLYGMPVALENVGLFVNTQLAKVPKSWSDLEKKALAFQKKGGGRVGLAVQQGSGGDAYHMYPFFSGLVRLRLRRTSDGRLEA